MRSEEAATGAANLKNNLLGQLAAADAPRVYAVASAARADESVDSPCLGSAYVPPRRPPNPLYGAWSFAWLCVPR